MARQIGKQVGRRLKSLREARGLAQAQLATISGKSIETISTFERGKVVTSLPTLEQIARILRVHLKDFFEDQMSVEDQPSSSKNALIVRNAPDFLSEDDLDIVATLVEKLAELKRRGQD